MEQTPDDGGSETHYESWFERMGSALMSMLFSPLAMAFSIAILWVNERRAARMDALIAFGEQECRTVEEAHPDKRGDLVHISSGKAVAKAPAQSKLFKNVSLKECLRLSATVEVYQWVEHSETKEKRDRVGGGTTKTTEYRYEKKWESTRHSSERYHNKKMQNRFPVDPKVLTTPAPMAEYVVDTPGAGWILPAGLLEQFTDFQCAADALGDSEVVCANGIALRRDGDSFYSAAKSNPQVGDIKATIEYVPDNQDATIVALQSKATKGSSMTETFLPYRPIRRGCCGISDGTRKEALLDEGELSREDLADADVCNVGPLACICCCCFACCGIVSRMMSLVNPAEIFKLYPGFINKRQCFSQIRSEASGAKWMLRIVGWLVLQISFMMFFEPFFMILNIVPFLEYFHITDAIQSVVFFISLLCTLMISFMIVSVAYLAYRPFVAMVYFAIAAAIAAVPLAIHMDYVSA